MHLILNSSTGTLVTVTISTAPDGKFHLERKRNLLTFLGTSLGRSRCR